MNTTRVLRGVGLSTWGREGGGEFAWRWTLSSRTGARGEAGKSNSLASGWRNGTAELVVLEAGKALRWVLLASWVGSSPRYLGVP